MHITKRIIDEIESTLDMKYNICVPDNSWDLFMTPLTDQQGNINFEEFETRQQVSIEIINQILDVHAKKEVVRFLAQLVNLEAKIQELQPWVRDHVVHAINTFVLGVFILENVEFPRMRKTRYGYPFMWKLCGPTHDLGYPIEIGYNIQKIFIDEMSGILSELNSNSPLIKYETYPEHLDVLSEGLDSNQLIQERLNEWDLEIDVENYYEWLVSKNKTDHGVISALSQLKVIEALYYSKNPKRESRDIVIKKHNWNQANFNLDIITSSAALFIHNIDLGYSGFSNKISFNRAPLAFLLFLCYTLQEWDRYAENRPVYSGNEFGIECEKKRVSVQVPEDIEEKIISTLNQRLSGLVVHVNGNIAIS